LRHAFGFGNVAKRISKQAGVVFFHDAIEVHGDSLVVI